MEVSRSPLLSAAAEREKARKTQKTVTILAGLALAGLIALVIGLFVARWKSKKKKEDEEKALAEANGNSVGVFAGTPSEIQSQRAAIAGEITKANTERAIARDNAVIAKERMEANQTIDEMKANEAAAAVASGAPGIFGGVKFEGEDEAGLVPLTRNNVEAVITIKSDEKGHEILYPARDGFKMEKKCFFIMVYDKKCPHTPRFAPEYVSVARKVLAKERALCVVKKKRFTSSNVSFMIVERSNVPTAFYEKGFIKYHPAFLMYDPRQHRIAQISGEPSQLSQYISETYDSMSKELWTQ